MASRRRVLTLGAVACTGLLVGCVDDDPSVTDITPTSTPSTPTPEPGTPTPTETPPATPTPPPAFTAEVEADPAEPVIHSVELEQPYPYDPVDPVTVEVTITNTGDEPVQLLDRRPALFWGVETGDVGLYPADAFDAYEHDPETGIWYATDEFFTSPGFESHELESDESESERLLVLYRHDSEVPTSYPADMVFETTYEYEDPAADDSVVVSAELLLSFGG